MLNIATPYLVFLGDTVNPLDAKTGRGLVALTAGVDARILGLASNQFVLPGYGVFHLGIAEPPATE